MRHFTLGSEHWHITCLVCTNCSATFDEGDLSKIYHRDGKVYCKDCMTSLFQICNVCGEVAKKFVNALGKIWHTFHFVCAECKIMLDEYVEMDGQAYCQDCHQRLSSKGGKKRLSFGNEKRASGSKIKHQPAPADGLKPWTPTTRLAPNPAAPSPTATPSTNNKTAAQPQAQTQAQTQPRGWQAKKPPAPSPPMSQVQTYKIVPSATSLNSNSKTDNSSATPSSPRSESYRTSPHSGTATLPPTQGGRYGVASPTSPAGGGGAPSQPTSAAAKAAKRISGKYTAFPHPPLSAGGVSSPSGSGTYGYSNSNANTTAYNTQVNSSSQYSNNSQYGNNNGNLATHSGSGGYGSPAPPVSSGAYSSGGGYSHSPAYSGSHSITSPVFTNAGNATNITAQSNNTASVHIKNPPAWMKNAPPDKGQPGRRTSDKIYTTGPAAIAITSSNTTTNISIVNNVTTISSNTTTTVSVLSSNGVTNRPRSSATSQPGAPPAQARGDGYSLAEILEAILRPLSEDEVGSVGSQAINLLSQMHQSGRLHKNIRHTNIFITMDGVVSLGEGGGSEEEKGESIRFRAPESKFTAAADVYSLGVSLWTSADYMLDDEEEPALSVEFCDLIGLMTDDTAANRPAVKFLQTVGFEKFRQNSALVLSAMMKEVERKRAIKTEIQESIIQKQKGLVKLLVKEIVSKSVKLRHVDRSTLPAPVKSVNPYEEMCKSIRDFSAKAHLRKVDVSKLPKKQKFSGPREILLDMIRTKPAMKHVVILAGKEISILIPPVPNFPRFGMTFRDITPLLREPKATSEIAKKLANRLRGNPPNIFMATPTDCGIYFASLVADMLNRGVLILQNTGKLPKKLDKYAAQYESIGYSISNMELQLPKYLIQPGERVVIIDEMLTNGAIIDAANHIIREAGCITQEVVCITEVNGFGGRAKLQDKGCPLYTMYQFDGESSFE